MYFGYWSCRKQWQYLDFAKYASYKQVGFLVHIQDGVGGGWVSTGWGRHHTCHRSFQRIHWNGAIQPISAIKESLMLLSSVICGRCLQRVDMLEPRAVFLPSWLWMSRAMLQTGCMHNANKRGISWVFVIGLGGDDEYNRSIYIILNFNSGLFCFCMFLTRHKSTKCCLWMRNAEKAQESASYRDASILCQLPSWMVWWGYSTLPTPEPTSQRKFIFPLRISKARKSTWSAGDTKKKRENIHFGAKKKGRKDLHPGHRKITA